MDKGGACYGSKDAVGKPAQKLHDKNRDAVETASKSGMKRSASKGRSLRGGRR